LCCLEEIDQQKKKLSPPKLTDAPDLLKALTSYVVPQSQRCYEQAVLYTCQGEDATEREKDILLNVSEPLGLTLIAIIDAEGHEENILAHNNVVSRLCDNEKKRLAFKRTDNPKRCYDGTFKYSICCPLAISNQTNQPGLSSVLSSCPFKKVLYTRTFIELNDDMCELSNDDWKLRPQLRYFCARALEGSIIINNKDNTAVLVNTVEVYGRKKPTDAHHERYMSNNKPGLPSTTLPPIITKYKNFWATASIQGNSVKLNYVSYLTMSNTNLYV
jgi:hypothetical protein